MSNQEMTRADHGMAIYSVLSDFRSRLKKAATSTGDMRMIDQSFNEAVEHLVATTGVVVKASELLTTTNNDEAVAMISLAARVRSFLQNHFRHGEWEVTIQPRGQKMVNAVNAQTYDHVATVVTKGKPMYFCSGDKGTFLFSSAEYWTKA